jgi:nicotinate-nucleotide--dimethylbenzimidazole phosphoribosyltransferase
MGNDVQLHESVVERAPGEERRASPRHAAASLGSVSARIIGGSPVDLVNFSARGVLFECDSRLLIGARASVRITTTDANIIVTGRVVRSRVKGLVNGALRYDAALALDSELALQPAMTATAPAMTVAAPVAAATLEDDDAPAEVAFESDDIAFESEPGIDGVFDPAPVEAYLAESDAALAEIAGAVDPPPIERAVEADADASASVDASSPESFEVNVTVGLEPIGSEPERQRAESAELASIEPEIEARALAPEAPEPAAGEPAADEPIAFEADGDDVAFEASADYEFEAMPLDDASFAPEPVDAASPVATAEPVADVAEAVVPLVADAPFHETAAAPEGSSMFDATYRPHVEDAPVASAPMFEVTPPMPVYESSASTMFDARPSEHYGESSAEPVAADAVPALPAGATAAAVEAEPEAIDFETEVSFEAEDAVMFESAFDESGVAPAAVEYAAVDDAAAGTVTETTETPVPSGIPAPEPVAAAATAGAVEPIDVIEPIEEGLDALANPPEPAPAADDRVLLQFSATVPHDLAELRRIAADNQW